MLGFTVYLSPLMTAGFTLFKAVSMSESSRFQYTVRVSARARRVNLCVRPATGLEVVVPMVPAPVSTPMPDGQRDPDARARLYNVTEDPGERFDLAASHPEIVAELTRLRDDHLASLVPVENQLLRR